MAALDWGRNLIALLQPSWVYGDRRSEDEVDDSGLDTASTSDSLLSLGLTQLDPVITPACSQVT